MAIDIPQEIYTDDKVCGEFLVSINERLGRISTIEKELKEAKEIASRVMLDRLEATGLKHFAFDFGTFAKTTKTQVAFPTAENGGKAAAVVWLEQVMDAGLIDLADILNVQQARVSADPVLAIEKLVEDYNAQHSLLNPEFVPIPPSPFNKHEQTTLSVPRKRKA